MVSILLTFARWKVVFSLFLILHRAFSHFMCLTFCQFRKRTMVQSWFQKLYWNQNCDLVGNRVVEIEIFNFCLFVCLFTCLFVPHVLPISQEENGPIIIPKTVLKSGLWRCSESGCGIFNLKLLYFSQHSVQCTYLRNFSYFVCLTMSPFQAWKTTSLSNSKPTFHVDTVYEKSYSVKRYSHHHHGFWSCNKRS